MKIVNVNGDGNKISYEVTGNKITFNDELMVNLEKYERDFEQTLDICMTNDKCLYMGLASSYVVQIIIPARKYELVENGEDENGNAAYIQEAQPLDMDTVELRLWDVEVSENE